MYNNYYDETDAFKPFTTSAPANIESVAPSNALRSEDQVTITPGLWPCLSETRDGWIQVEDHRGKEGYLHGVSHTINGLGPLPDGWTETPPPHAPTPEEAQQQFINAMQQRLDTFAQTRGYDGILSAATYAASTVPKFRTEGQYAVEARDAAWAKGHEILEAVLSGARPMPTIDEVLAELPALTWPEA